MCGIAGFFGRRPVAASAVDAMRAAIARRGPDAFHVAGARELSAPLSLQADFGGLQQAMLHAAAAAMDLHLKAFVPPCQIAQDAFAATHATPSTVY